MSRLWSLLLSLVVFGALAIPATVQAQEEEDTPPVLRLSFFMCDFGGENFDEIEQEMKTQDIPIWNALIAEGKVQQHGYFFHWWADEWNLGVYTIGATLQGIVDAVGEAGDKLEAQYGDAPNAVSRYCPHHRDGFYTMGPTAGMPAAN